MKKVLKVVMIILLVIVLLITGILFLLYHTLKTELGDHWKDYAKVFAMQTEVSKNLPPLEHIEERKIEVQYIRYDGTLESRPVRLYIPTDVEQPIPLIYVPHYEMAENAAELRRYLEKGWAVASPRCPGYAAPLYGAGRQGKYLPAAPRCNPCRGRCFRSCSCP